MDIQSRATDKVLLLNTLRNVLKQGEKLADKPVFVLPVEREGVDLSSLSWMLTASTDKNTLTRAYDLPASVENDELRITWDVTSNFTDVATDKMQIALIGSDADGYTVVKFFGDDPIFVARDKVGEYAPPEDILSAALSQINSIFAQIEEIEYNPVRVDPETGNLFNYINGEWVDSGVTVEGAGDMLSATYDPLDATGKHPVAEAGGIPAYVAQEFPGGGDMKTSDYDPDGEVKEAGGITEYIKYNASSASSTTIIDDQEQRVGWYMVNTDSNGVRWYKPQYRRRVNYGPLLNASTLSVPYPMADYDVTTIEYVYGHAVNTDGTRLPIGYPSSATDTITLLMGPSSFLVRTYDNKSDYTKCVADFEYTKTTDTAIQESEIPKGSGDVQVSLIEDDQERIVGWKQVTAGVDGYKPLYRKPQIVNSFPNATSAPLIFTGMDNAENVEYEKGWVEFPGAGKRPVVFTSGGAKLRICDDI